MFLINGFPSFEDSTFFDGLGPAFFSGSGELLILLGHTWQVLDRTSGRRWYCSEEFDLPFYLVDHAVKCSGPHRISFRAGGLFVLSVR